MSIDNWRTRTPEEKEELRARIMQLLQDDLPRTQIVGVKLLKSTILG